MRRKANGMICLFAVICPSVLFTQGSDISLGAIEQQYSELRQVSLDPQAIVEVDGLVIRKDVTSFELTSGHLYFFRSIADR
ncbi:MAG: hypothetical protein JSU64_02530, partial [candidate division WOR-3 bacterium]